MAAAPAPSQIQSCSLLNLVLNHWRVSLALVCAAALLSLSSPPTASAAETGISVQGSAATSIADANALGVTWVRRFVRWDVTEPQRSGSYDGGQIGELDDFIYLAQAAKKKIALTVIGAPRWANGSSDFLTPPSDPASYASFIGRLATRYKGRVQSWEIWNEPDEAEFWHGTTPSPANYAPLLKASYAAIKTADPATQVVAGPLTGNNYQFLEGLYSEGARGHFDAVGVHTDTACGINSPSSFYREDGRVGRFTFLGFREVHAVMAANGDGDKPITMSEMGWSTTTLTCERGKWAGLKDAGVSEAKQADYLAEAYHCLAGYPYMKSAIWFSTRDGGAAESELNRYGLIRWNGTKRASWAAMADLAARGDQLTSSCGDLEPPTVKIIAPTSTTEFEDEIVIAATGDDADSGLKSLRFYINGVAVAGASAKNDELFERTIKTSQLPYGANTVMVRAIDNSGARAFAEIAVNRIKMSKLAPQRTALELKIVGKQRTKTVTGRLSVPGTGLLASGRVLLRWQLYTRKSWATERRSYYWVTRYGRSKSPAAQFVFKQKLAKKGLWRLTATYASSYPFTQAAAQKTLRVR